MRQMLFRTTGCGLIGLLAMTLSSCGGSPNAGGGNAPPAGGVVSFEEYCNVPGVPKAVRQTVLVIDENAIHANPGPGKIAPENLVWTRWIGGLLGKPGDLGSSALSPRERLTVLVAPRDGAEPRTVFTGCFPAFSTAEVQAIAKDQGTVGSAGSDFFGSGPVQAAAKKADRFRSLLGGALTRLGDQRGAADQSDDSFASSALLASLRQKSLADLADGIPRVIIYSDLARFPVSETTVPDARRAGFALARKTPLELRRAEVFVAGVKAGEQTELSKAFIDAFMLGSEGQLRGFGSGDQGLRGSAPDTVRVFSGMIRYGSEDVPARLRLATTPDGRIVDSWIAVRRNVETATPFDGELVSDGGGGETGRNDGKTFGQLWSLDPDPEPEFGPDMAFGGLRSIEFRLTASGLIEGKVFDPVVDRINGSAKPYIEFKLHRDEKSLF